jgi:hypothetical protein
MTTVPSNIGSPVKDFVGSFLEGLEAGLRDKGYVPCSESECHAKMELHAVATVEVGGEGGAKILGVGGSIQTNNSDTSSQKITVFVKKMSESDKEEEKAKIERAKVEQKYAMPLAYRRAEAGNESTTH